MFEKRPSNPIRSNTPIDPGVAPFAQPGLHSGYASILQPLLQMGHQPPTSSIRVAIDGTHGAQFQLAIQHIQEQLEKHGHHVAIMSSSSFVKPGEELRSFFADNITDNRAFGYFTRSTLEDYFIPDAQESFLAYLDDLELPANQISFIITYGPGAFWLGQEQYDLSFFLDVSREYQQMQHKKQLLNFGFSYNLDDVEKYKICLFVEWPVFESYRKAILEHVQYYVDMNAPQEPNVTTTHTLRQMIHHLAQAPMRVKPFFAPGMWGGQYLKKFANLPQDWVNCAWGFEPIAPENSILLEYNGSIIEVPFLTIMHYEHPAILGDRLVDLFGDYFPIRFDYLDTIDGDNLSCQVHPKQDYIRSEFNEFMTQQESYYIMEKQGPSTVYLGLTEDCTKESFIEAVQTAQETAVPINIADYVNEFQAEKGDLYLIPTGTVHASGKNNLVLEISSTTWWFTFKIYDFLRKGLDGKPRPINIEHALPNIDFHKKTSWVKENLIAKPKLLRAQGSNEEYVLGQRDDLLFYVHRLHVTDSWNDQTNQEMVMYNLVEGERVRIVSVNDETVFVEFSLAESYILPAAFGAYRIVNLGEQPCKLIKAGVSKDWDVSLLED